MTSFQEPIRGKTGAELREQHAANRSAQAQAVGKIEADRLARRDAIAARLAELAAVDAKSLPKADYLAHKAEVMRLLRHMQSRWG